MQPDGGIVGASLMGDRSEKGGLRRGLCWRVVVTYWSQQGSKANTVSSHIIVDCKDCGGSGSS